MTTRQAERMYFHVTGERASEGAFARVNRAVNTLAARTVLVVEDERGVREFAARSLGQHGYRVCLAESADEAWAALRQQERPDMVLLDVVLPGEHHSALTAHIERTGSPVVLMSGYSEQHVKHPRLTHAAPVLERPFTVDQLLWAVRDALRSSTNQDVSAALTATKVASYADHVAVGSSNAEA